MIENVNLGTAYESFRARFQVVKGELYVEKCILEASPCDRVLSSGHLVRFFAPDPKSGK